MTTVAALLQQARGLGVDRLDAQVIVATRLRVERTWILAHGDAELGADAAAACRDDFARRAAGVPLSYIVGEREFHGLRLAVTPAVLDPRPDTETLVDWALELIAGGAQRVVDLGTGSGAIALAVKHARPHAEVHATDADEQALSVARANAARLGLDVRFAHGDWWHAVAGQRFHLALSNPPYVAAGDSHLAALMHEPRHALTPGPSGFEAIERIVAGAEHCLEAQGWLLLEHGHDQSEAVRDLLLRHGFEAPATRTDLAGVPRCTGAKRPP
jgi:release factor glutamine methyltransferase